MIAALLKVVILEKNQQNQYRGQIPINVHMPPMYSGQASNYPPPGQQIMMMVDAYAARPPVTPSLPQLTYEPSVASGYAPSQQ